eukprot:TRINITY_DN813_c0_g1_i1.p1 TRINITY_DN813_c0_g1~~TRINITY_DN813_c0_g1_i1.p1  ORF type:complete len:127 (+),score=14.69 TRINITY_DN813_c0_g1_i1:411-791(+)
MTSELHGRSHLGIVSLKGKLSWQYLDFLDCLDLCQCLVHLRNSLVKVLLENGAPMEKVVKISLIRSLGLSIHIYYCYYSNLHILGGFRKCLRGAAYCRSNLLEVIGVQNNQGDWIEQANMSKIVKE